MDNEDKIINILVSMQSDINARFDGINDRFDKLESDIAVISHEVKAIREQTEHLTEFEAETRKSLSELKA